MAKKVQKLKPDTVLKNYWSDNEQFADLFNGVEFVMLALEHQEHIHYAMPMRVMVMIMAHTKNSMIAMRSGIKQQMAWKKMNFSQE